MNRLRETMDKHLITVTELARVSEIADNSVRRAMGDRGPLRVATKRRILDGINRLLKQRGVDMLSAEYLFGGHDGG